MHMGHTSAKRCSTPSQEPEGVRIVMLVYMQRLVQSQVTTVQAGGEVEVRYAKAGDQEQQGMSQEDEQHEKHLHNVWQVSQVRQCVNSQKKLRHTSRTAALMCLTD